MLIEEKKPVAVPEVQKEEQIIPAETEKKDELVSYKTHRELLDEKKKLQVKYEKLIDDQQKQKAKELEEQGKFKELYDKTYKENEELRNFRKVIEDNIQSEIEEEIQGLDDTTKELINEIPDLSKKLSYIRKLKNKNTGRSQSPVSDRAGGDVQIGNINLAEYRGPAGRAKLLQLQKTDPKLFEKILELKK